MLRSGTMSFRVGVDIGGTFTDIVFLDADGRLHIEKVSSSVEDYAHAIVDGLRKVFAATGLTGGDVAEVLHGTTVASNALLELRGARTGLITTKGFRDVLEIRHLRMPRLYDLTWQKPPTLVERRLRVEVDERIDAHGQVQRPLADADVERALDRLLAEKIEGLAVCLLNAYANPVHETRIKAIVRRRAPELPLCVSSDVLPEIKEYERTSTTVINTYVLPIVGRYLATLRAGLDAIGARAPLLIMQSNGGLMTAEAAAARPMHIIESGPAAGVVGAQALARRIGLGKLVTFDMGGTTAKASLVEDGAISRATEYQVGGGIMHGSRLLTGAGYLLRVPAIDLAEVGAGGGSIVWIDAGGALQVGPRSAGASPGPVCYDLGGTEPTVTDANVILGYLNPAALAGGAVKLNAGRAHEVFQGRIARPLGMSLEEAAHGAHLIAASNMMRAIKAVSSERGRDPREYALFAFGGNGPLFAAGMARALEMTRVVVPPAPGLFSAFGLLYSEVEHHYVRTWRRATRGLDPGELDEAFGRLERDALAQLAAEGFTGDRVRITRYADCRYQGQSFELTVPVPGGPPAGPEAAAGGFDASSESEHPSGGRGAPRLRRGAPSSSAPPGGPGGRPEPPMSMTEAFGREHERTYGHRAGPDEPVEIVSLRVIGQGLTDRPRVPGRVHIDRGGPAAAGTTRRVYFGPDEGWITTPILTRGDLATARSGPAVIEEYDATCVIPPDTRARLDEWGNIVMDLRTEARI
jgi:N-methylhydantoinase A